MEVGFIRPRVEVVTNEGVVLRLVGFMFISQLAQAVIQSLTNCPEVYKPRECGERRELVADQDFFMAVFPHLDIFNYRGFYLEHPKVVYYLEDDLKILVLKFEQQEYKFDLD